MQHPIPLRVVPHDWLLLRAGDLFPALPGEWLPDASHRGHALTDVRTEVVDPTGQDPQHWFRLICSCGTTISGLSNAHEFELRRQQMAVAGDRDADDQTS